MKFEISSQVLSKYMSEAQITHFIEFSSSYSLDARFSTKENRTLKDNKSSSCRFCGKSSPKVTFNVGDTHVIPQLLGKGNLLSSYECDSCNQRFGKEIENHLGNYLTPERALFSLKGKKGHIKLKRKDGFEVKTITNLSEFENQWPELASLSQVVKEKTGKLIFIQEGEFTNISKKPNSLKLTIPRSPYNPFNIFKVFCKIFIGLIPEDELNNFSRFRELLLYPGEENSNNPLFNLHIQELPIWSTVFEKPEILMLKRNYKVKDVFERTMIVCFGNKMYQLIIPSNKNIQDGSEGKKFRIIKHSPFYNPILSEKMFSSERIMNILTNSVYSKINLSSSEIVKNDSIIFEITQETPFISIDPQK